MLDCSTIDGDSLLLLQLCLDQQASIQEGIDTTNNLFLLFCATMILMMEGGLVMLSLGVLNSKNHKSLIMCTLLDMCMAAIAFYLVGYGFMFGKDAGGFIGTSHFVGESIGSTQWGDHSLSFYTINYLWCSIRATIMTGPTAGRANFFGYGLISFYSSALVFPVCMHWVFGHGGFLMLGKKMSLMQTGVVDFAACGGLHLLAGLSGCIYSHILGPRQGRFDAVTGKAKTMPDSLHPAFASLGVFILFTGWLGFNPGSTVFIHGGRGVVLGRAAINSIFSACAAVLSSTVFAYWYTGERKLLMEVALNGVLAGLVSVTGCCAFIELWAAFCVGAIGGVVYVVVQQFVLHRLKVDDPLEATAVHAGCGVWGIIAGAFFTNPRLLVPFFQPGGHGAHDDEFITVPSGVFYGAQAYATVYSNGTQVPGGASDVNGALVVNAVVLIVCVTGWVVCTFTPVVWLVNRMGMLRASSDLELMGLDVMHGEEYEPLPHKQHKEEEEEEPHAVSQV